MPSSNETLNIYNYNLNLQPGKFDIFTHDNNSNTYSNNYNVNNLFPIKRFQLYEKNMVKIIVLYKINFHN